MSKSFTFATANAFVSNRPYADVRLISASMGTPTHRCIVDTGADYIQLPACAATSVGINLAGYSIITVSTASGTGSMILATGLDIEVEGVFLKGESVLFDTANSPKMLLGRISLLNAFDVGFEVNTWHR